MIVLLKDQTFCVTGVALLFNYTKNATIRLGLIVDIFGDSDKLSDVFGAGVSPLEAESISVLPIPHPVVDDKTSEALALFNYNKQPPVFLQVVGDKHMFARLLNENRCRNAVT